MPRFIDVDGVQSVSRDGETLHETPWGRAGSTLHVKDAAAMEESHGDDAWGVEFDRRAKGRWDAWNGTPTARAFESLGVDERTVRPYASEVPCYPVPAEMIPYAHALGVSPCED